jgi:phosphatidylglycerophosphate synthase
VATLMVGVVSEMLFGGSLVVDAALSWILVVAATAALLLDGVDGWVARQTGMVSDFGARFDMEADALFLLTMSLLVHATGKVGIWVLASGLMRYAFVLAGWLWPPLAAQLLPLWRRKTIYAVQVLALIAALAPVVPADVAHAICLVSLVPPQPSRTYGHAPQGQRPLALSTRLCRGQRKRTGPASAQSVSGIRHGLSRWLRDRPTCAAPLPIGTSPRRPHGRSPTIPTVERGSTT